MRRSDIIALWVATFSAVTLVPVAADASFRDIS
jgi:hypothetical protein